MVIRRRIFLFFFILITVFTSLLVSWNMYEIRAKITEEFYNNCESVTYLPQQSIDWAAPRIREALAITDRPARIQALNRLLQPSVSQVIKAFQEYSMGIYVTDLNTHVAFGPDPLSAAPDALPTHFPLHEVLDLGQGTRCTLVNPSKDMQMIAYVRPFIFDGAVIGLIWAEYPLDNINQFYKNAFIRSFLFWFATIVLGLLGSTAILNQLGQGLAKFSERLKESSPEAGGPISQLPELQEVYRVVMETRQQLKDQRNFLHKVLSTIPSGVIVIDREGKILLFNPAAGKLLQTDDPQSMVGVHILDFLATIGGNAENSRIMKTLRDGIPFTNIDLGIYTRIENVLLDTTPIFDEQGQPNGVLAVYTDITHLRQWEKEMVKSEQHRVLSQLAATLTHEIKNPLTSVQNYIHILKSTAKNEEDREIFQAITRELDRVIKISLEFLSLSRPKIPLRQPLMMDSLLRDVCQIMVGFSKLHQIPLQLDIRREPMFMGDEAQLKQAFINLVKNAIEASSPGKAVTIVLDVDRENNIVIEIRDQGSGITAENLKRLGEAFFTTKSGGNGLGLTVTYEMIHNHDGNIEVESAPGHGTTFRILLPLE